MQFLLARGVVEVGFGFPGGASGKESASSAGDTRDMGSIPGSGRSPGGENGNLLQYSCLEKLHGQKEPGGMQSMGSQNRKIQVSRHA